MYKKMVSIILSSTIIFSSFNISVLQVKANEIFGIENNDLGASDLEIQVPETEEPETENSEIEIPDVELPSEDGFDAESGEVFPNEEEKTTVLEEEQMDEKLVENTNNLDELALKYKDELLDGTYYIRTNLSNNKVLGIAGNPLANKSNVVIKTFKKEDSYRWKVQHDKKGYVTFINEKSGKVLDVYDAGKSNDKKVWQYTSNHSLAQKWIARKDGNSYEIISAINGMVLDVKGANSVDNTGMQIHKPNNSKAQRFQMISANPKVMSNGENVEQGKYYMIPSNNQEKVIDIAGNSDVNKANVEISSFENRLSQMFKLEYHDGYYAIINQYSFKALDVEAGSFMPGTNVWQYNYNGSAAQKWAIQDHEDGTYSFISVQNGMALGVDGNNIQIQNPGEGKNQRFILKEAENHMLNELAEKNKNVLEDGTYYIRSALKNTSVIEPQENSVSNRTDIVIHQFDKDSSQRWKVTHDEKGYVTFINEKSGKALDVYDSGRSSEKKVWQYTPNNSLAQKWIVEKSGTNYMIFSALNGMVLEVRDGKSSDNTGLQIQGLNNAATRQKFQMIPSNPQVEQCDEIVPSGYYYICAKGDNKYALDIYGGSDANRANVQLYKANQSFAQAFDIRYQEGYYTIRNMYSNKMLDVYDGGFMPGTNVWQYTDNGSKAQKWSVKDNGDGSYTFISVNSGMALDIYGGETKAGSNVQVYTPNGSTAQKFVLKKAESFYAGWYNICSAVNNSYVMEIAGGNTANKTNIQLYRNNNTESQKWNAIKNSDGTFRFENSKSKKVMDVYDGKTYDGNIVWSYTYNGSMAQKWKVEKLKDNTWRIVSAINEDYVLSLDKGNAGNKAKIVVRKWENKKDQKWIFKKVNVSKRVIDIEISDGEKYILDKGNIHTLKAKEIYTIGTGNAIMWQSSDPGVVSVTDAGVIKALRSGNATITAKSKSDSSVSKKIKVYVRETKGQISKAKLDAMNLSKVKKLMIVAHPDDETFWGGGHLIEDDWLVVCITNGRNKVRSKEYANAMRYSGDKAIMLDYADYNDEKVRDNWEYAERGIRKDIELLVTYKKWNQIVVHNPEGEYGHMHHKILNRYTTEICKNKGKYNELYYFGKFYWSVPQNLKSNLSKETLAKKKKLISAYPSQMTAYERTWKQMEPHEHWVKASKW